MVKAGTVVAIVGITLGIGALAYFLIKRTKVAEVKLTEITTESECTAKGGYWYFGTCHAKPMKGAGVIK